MTSEQDLAPPQSAEEDPQQGEPYVPLRDAQGRLLPGQASINPAGRKPNSHRARTLARAHTPEAIDVLVDSMRKAPTAEARIKAAIALLDRGWGRPAQQLSAELNAPPAIVVNLGWLKGREVERDIPHDGWQSQPPVSDRSSAPGGVLDFQRQK